MTIELILIQARDLIGTTIGQRILASKNPRSELSHLFPEVELLTRFRIVEKEDKENSPSYCAISRHLTPCAVAHKKGDRSR